MSNPCVFFTGFPGFIGKRLVQKIKQEGAAGRFRFLVQENMLAAANEVLKKDFSELDYEVLVGDITKKDLGLSKAVLAKLREEVNDVFHLAAIYDLSVAEEVAFKVNVTGTINILDFCESLENFHKLVYFSTCYVAGKRTGRIYEADLQKEQSFKNYYESTKYLAEVEVGKRSEKLNTIIIRPSIVVGDSQTGETQKFDGPYFMMKFIDTFDFLLNVPLIGEAQAFFNIVPVDYIIDASVALWLKKDNSGTTYQLADPNPIRAKDLFAILSEHIIGRAPKWSLPHILIKTVLSIPMIAPALGIPVESLMYLKHPVEYDCENTTRDLKDSNVRCPSVQSYIGVLVAFYKQHKNDDKYRVAVH